MGMGLVSYADLQRWPDDGHQYELYDGEVRVVPSATNRHQLVAQRLYDELRAFERLHGGRILMAPSDVVFNQYNVLQPDLLYFAQTRKHLVQLDTPTDASPDLTIEILSPSTSAHDRMRKQAMYARFGVGEYWIVDPAAETIEIFVLEHGFYRFASITGRDAAASSPTIDGLGVDTSQVFDIG